jgi:hypothetical protein
MEDIISDYKSLMPVIEICRKYTIGKKKLYSLLKENNIQLRPHKSKSLIFPYQKGQVIDSITIMDDDYYFDGERWTIRILCVCGNIDYKRISSIKNSRYKICKICCEKMEYSEYRKQRSDIFDKNGLNKVWLTGIKNNLVRGVMKERKLNCDITSEDLYNQLKDQDFKCALTGIPLNVILLTRKETNASVDRIDSSKGYVKGNIQWVTKDVNLMKNKYSQNYFIETCCKVAKLHGNFEPSSQNDIEVSEKVQRLEVEESNQ